MKERKDIYQARYRKRRAEGIESIRFLWDDDDEPDKKNIRNSPSSDLLFIQVQSSPVPMDKITNAVVVSVIFFFKCFGNHFPVFQFTKPKMGETVETSWK